MRASLLVVAIVAAAQPAAAYVRTKTSTGTPIAWRRHCPQLVLDAQSNPDLSQDRLRTAINHSADAWNGPTADCANPRLTLSADVSHGRGVSYDDANVVLWRLPGFCDDTKNAQDEVCTSPNAAAVTTVFYYDKPGSDKDGELLQVDIELNSTHFSFSDDGSPTKIDLENTLTHELGHVLGLDHTCYTLSGAVPPMDSNGDPVPSCFPLTQLSAQVTDATMFNFEAPGETSKRVPKADETSGVCAFYQGRADVCEAPDGAGCQFVPHSLVLPVSIGILLGVYALLFILGLYQRRRK